MTGGQDGGKAGGRQKTWGFRKWAEHWHSQWRASEGLEPGKPGGKKPPSASLIAPEDAFNLRNFTAEARDYVEKHRACVRESTDRFAGADTRRNILTSQAMCLNLFAPFAELGENQPVRNAKLAAAVFQKLFPDRVGEVTRVRFEHSPGLGKLEYLGDNTAFDVFVEYSRGAATGFLGVETKYVEKSDGKTVMKDRYRKVAAAGVRAGKFKPDWERTIAGETNLNQIWRNHMLAMVTVKKDGGPYDEYLSVHLHPSGNKVWGERLAKYNEILVWPERVEEVTLERVLDALEEAGASWAAGLRRRYLGGKRAADEK